MAADGYRVGVLGATGLVGSTILELLATRDFPAREIVPFASERSAGKEIEWEGKILTCHSLSEDSIQGLDLVLSSAGGSISAEWTPKLVEAGATVVDNTSYWRMHDDVPVVVSEVNPDALAGHSGIIANPNCSTMQMVVALKPLYDAAGIERLVISTYQAVSGTGKGAIDELRAQARAVVGGYDVPAPGMYPHLALLSAFGRNEVMNAHTKGTSQINAKSVTQVAASRLKALAPPSPWSRARVRRRSVSGAEVEVAMSVIPLRRSRRHGACGAGTSSRRSSRAARSRPSSRRPHTRRGRT